MLLVLEGATTDEKLCLAREKFNKNETKTLFEETKNNNRRQNEYIYIFYNKVNHTRAC